MKNNAVFNIECTQCERLTNFLAEVKTKHPSYHAKPVAPFGNLNSKLLIVGLAPGMHGANATGRPFTGDYAGILLYETLFKFGFSNQAESSHNEDGLKLINCRITNAVKCLPPENKPSSVEIKTCNRYLENEIKQIKPRVILALGKIAHDAVLKSLGIKLSTHKFSHHAQHLINNDTMLIDSYHCSRYNTQTKRLTEPMFHDNFKTIRKMLDA